MSDYLEKRVMLILYTVGIIMLIVRLIATSEGRWEEITSDPDWQEKMGKVQFILEVLLTSSFVMCVIPRWLGRIKNTKAKDILGSACTLAGIVILVSMLPEISDRPVEEQRLIYVALAVAVLGSFWALSYWYGKKHKNGEEEESGEVEVDSDEKA